MKIKFDKQMGVVTNSDLRTAKGKLVYFMMILILLVACFVALVPSFWAFMTGFKETKEIYTSRSFFPESFSLVIAKERILSAMQAMQFWKMSLNTLVVSLGDVFFSIVISGMGGYVISRLKRKGSAFIFMLVVWTMMMPGQIRTVPLYISYLSFPFVAEVPGEISLLNTYWPMWLNAAANCFNIILFKNHFDSISVSLVEAARLDGCGNGRIFVSIMLPLSKPIMLYVAIMAMRGSWAEFFTPYLVLSDQSIMTLPQRIFLLQTERTMQMNTYLLCLVLSCLPMFTLFVFFSKQITQGINIGGVKG